MRTDKEWWGGTENGGKGWRGKKRCRDREKWEGTWSSGEGQGEVKKDRESWGRTGRDRER